MNFNSCKLFALLFCGLTLAQIDTGATTDDAQLSSSSDTSTIMREFREKLQAMETRLEGSENQILELKTKGEVKLKRF